MKRRIISVVAVLALLLMLLPVPAAAQTPKVTITSPQNGATLSPGSITVTVNVTDFTLKPPSSTNVAGQGHLHYYMDVQIPTAPGAPAVTAPGTYKVDPGTTMTWDNVTAGPHSFGVQLVNNNHTPLEPPVTASVIVTVAAAAAPKVTITSPAPNATLPPGNINVTVSVTNLTLKPPSSTNVVGEGHLHYYMDVDIPTTPGKGAVTAPGTYKADPNTTITWENVPAGTHTFGVQLVNNNHTPLEPPVTATVTVKVAAAAAAPTLTIVSPAPNATLPPGNVNITVSVSNFTLKPPTGQPNAAGEGHLHYYKDVTIPTTPGAPAVTAGGSYKVDPGTTMGWDNVPAGTHTFGVQLVNNNHTPLQPPVTATVTVKVEAPSAQPPSAPAAPAAPAPQKSNAGLIIGLIIAAVVIIVIIVFWQRSLTKKA